MVFGSWACRHLDKLLENIGAFPLICNLVLSCIENLPCNGVYLLLLFDRSEPCCCQEYIKSKEAIAAYLLVYLCVLDTTQYRMVGRPFCQSVSSCLQEPEFPSLNNILKHCQNCKWHIGLPGANIMRSVYSRLTPKSKYHNINNTAIHQIGISGKLQQPAKFKAIIIIKPL